MGDRVERLIVALTAELDQKRKAALLLYPPRHGEVAKQGSRGVSAALEQATISDIVEHLAMRIAKKAAAEVELKAAHIDTSAVRPMNDFRADAYLLKNFPRETTERSSKFPRRRMQSELDAAASKTATRLKTRVHELIAETALGPVKTVSKLDSRDEFLTEESDDSTASQ